MCSHEFRATSLTRFVGVAPPDGPSMLVISDIDAVYIDGLSPAQLRELAWTATRLAERIERSYYRSDRPLSVSGDDARDGAGIATRELAND